MQFNFAIFEKFYKLAITNIEDLQIGQTYFENFSGGSFMLKELITNKELYARYGLKYHNKDDADKINWIVTENDETKSLQDNNICNSYNPWMLFTDKKVCEQARKELVITFIAA